VGPHVQRYATILFLLATLLHVATTWSWVQAWPHSNDAIKSILLWFEVVVLVIVVMGALYVQGLNCMRAILEFFCLGNTPRPHPSHDVRSRTSEDDGYYFPSDCPSWLISHGYWEHETSV
jgi:hypothetical protein